jgi:hypothetical protein
MTTRVTVVIVVDQPEHGPSASKSAVVNIHDEDVTPDTVVDVARRQAAVLARDVFPVYQARINKPLTTSE